MIARPPASGRAGFVVIGDSLTEHGTWPELLCAETGWTLMRAAKSGQTTTEIAMSVGARSVELVVTGALVAGEIPVVPDPAPGEVRELVAAGMADVEVRGELGGRPGVLVHRVNATAREGWGFRPDGPVVLGAEKSMRFRPEVLSLPPAAVVVLWCGRNNPGLIAVDDVDAIVRHVRSTTSGVRVLVLGVHAAAFEPFGSDGAALIAEMNTALESAHGEGFLDVQAALTAAVPTADAVAAPSLRSDDVHLNTDGDRIVAQAIRTRLMKLGWWPSSDAERR